MPGRGRRGWPGGRGSGRGGAGSRVSPGAPHPRPARALPAGEEELEPALSGKWVNIPLSKKVKLTHNTALFRFDLPLGPRQPLGLGIGKHIRLRAVDAQGNPVKDAEGQISRSYTPVTPEGIRGHVDFVIKIYPQGRFTQWIDKISVGDLGECRAPRGRRPPPPGPARGRARPPRRGGWGPWAPPPPRACLCVRELVRCHVLGSRLHAHAACGN